MSKTNKLCTAQIFFLITGTAINIYLYTFTMFDMLTMFGFNILNGIISVFVFVNARNEGKAFPILCNILLIGSIIANFYRVKDDNLGYLIFYSDVLETIYYILLTAFLLLNITFFIIYANNIRKAKCEK